MAKQTRQTVDRWFSPAADRTMRKTETANGPPSDRGRLVTGKVVSQAAERNSAIGLLPRMKMGPRCFRRCSFAASLADVELAGYSPPVPKPIMPRETVSIQNMP